MIYNYKKPVLEVYHKNLKRVDDEHLYRTHCLVCEDGVMLVGRDPEKGFISLLANDNCIACGQRYRYLDIDELNKNQGVHT